MRFAIIEKKTGTIDSTYFSDTGQSLQRKYGGVHGDPNLYLHIPILNYEKIDWLRFNFFTNEFEIDEEKKSNVMKTQWITVRKERNNKLTQYDWTMLLDSPLSDDEKNMYMIYRQKLRDLPSFVSDPFAVDWPEPPKL